MPQQEAYTRAIAGLTLKNNIRSLFNDIPLLVLDHVKTCCMETLHKPDADVSVRRTVASVITAIVTRAHPHNCNDIFNHLLDILTNSNSPIAIEVCIDLVVLEYISYLDHDCRWHWIHLPRYVKMHHKK